MSHRVRAVIEYDGTDYAGFQWQPDQATIQGEIESVVRRLTGEAPRILGAGRTDAGVHALGQVIAFDTGWRHPFEDLRRGMNALLSASIAVRTLESCDERFHPRFDATSRWYRYTIVNRPVRSPIQGRYAWHIARSLDVGAVDQLSGLLIGSHDFATFGQATEGEVTVRQVLSVDWERSGDLVWMDIRANAFLRTMVRTLAGTLVRVGLGEMTAQEFVERFRGEDRSLASPPAPPQGLCLMAVQY